MRSRPNNDTIPEPSLHDLLSDPVAQTLMKRDGVTAEAVIDLIRRLRAARGLI